MKRLIILFSIFSGIILCIFLLFGHLESYFESTLLASKANPFLYSLFSFLILSSDIILPVPSTLVMHLNGMILGVIPGFLISLLSLMVSSLLGYWLGSIGKKDSKDQKNLHAEKLVQSYGVYALIFTRGIPILAESISLICGHQRLPFRAYVLFSLIGYIPICLIYALFGDWGNQLFFVALGVSFFLTLILWLFGKKLLQNLLIEAV